MQKQQGNSMLEVLLVIAVTALLIVLAIRYFTIVDFNRRVAEAISKVDILSRASYEWLASERQPDFSAIKEGELIALGLVSKADLVNPWGGKITVDMGSDGNHVKVTLSGIAPAACTNLRRHLDAIAYTEVDKKSCKHGKYYGEF